MKDRRIWIIFLIIFVNLLGFGIILPLLPYYVESMGAGAITIGLLSAAYSLFQLLAAPILGELSDKIGRRPVLIFSLIGTTLSFFLLGIANTILVLFISRIIDGISGGNISAAQAYIADITSKENRTQGMGVMMAAFSLGFILGPAIGGILSQYGYSVPAFAAAIVSLIATLLTIFFLPESLDLKKVAAAPAKKVKRFFSLKDFYDALTHPNIGIVLTITFMVMFAFSLMEGTFALFSEHTLHLEAKDVGYMFAFLGSIGIIMQLFFLKRITNLLSEKKAVVISVVLMTLALIILAFANSTLMLYAALSLLAIGNSISGPILSGILSKLTPDNEQGNVMGTSQSVGSFARLIGPLIGTTIFSVIGIRSPYIFGAGVLLLTTGVTIRYLKSSNK